MKMIKIRVGGGVKSCGTCVGLRNNDPVMFSEI